LEQDEILKKAQDKDDVISRLKDALIDAKADNTKIYLAKALEKEQKEFEQLKKQLKESGRYYFQRVHFFFFL